MPTEDPFVQEQIAWAERYWPECRKGMDDKPGDRRHILACCGAVVRRRAKMDVRWLWRAIERDDEAVLRLSPYIGTFEASGGFCVPPTGLDWNDYVSTIVAVSDSAFYLPTYSMMNPVDTKAGAANMPSSSKGKRFKKPETTLFG